MSAAESDQDARRQAPDLSFLDRPTARVPEIPNLSMSGTDPRSNDRRDALRRPGDGKVLTVGNGICVKGEISACDTLVVEGTVAATLASGKTLNVSHGGVFTGTATVDNAVVAGKFDGDLTVRDKLRVATGGRVMGKVRYAKLEIEVGGELNGDVSVSAAGD